MSLHKNKSDLKTSLEQVQQPIEKASGMFNAAYTHDEYFSFERDNVLGTNWAAIAFSNELPNNSYVKPIDFMGIPLAIMKNEGGDIQVFHNVCSHRGMKLVQKEGSVGKMICCPYHSWTYDLDGNLKATPHIGGVNIHQTEGFNCADHGLKKVRCHIWLGMVFINLSGDAVSFSEFIKPLESRWPTFAQQKDTLSVPDDYGSLSLTIKSNWKLAVENYCEAYHLPWVHPTLNRVSPLNQHYNLMIGDNMSGQGTRVYNNSEVAGNILPTFESWPQAQAKTGEYISLYPNVLLGVQLDHVFAIILHPLSANKTLESLQLYFIGEGASDEKYSMNRKAVLDSWRVVFGEDVFAVEGMQAGRQSPGYTGGAFSPVLDESSHHFHKWIANHYANAS